MSLFLALSLLLVSGGMPASAQTQQAACGTTYTVVQGDTLSGIALHCGASVQALLRANPQIDTPRLIYPGQQLLLPGAEIRATDGSILYIVQSGDTLTAIANRYDLTLSQLRSANPQLAGNILQPGDRLWITSAPVLPDTGQAPPIIGIAPNSGPAGSQVTVAGVGFPSNGPLQVLAGLPGRTAQVRQSLRAGEDGNFTARFNIPSSAQAGSLWVIQAVASTGESATAQFLVEAPGSLPQTYVVQRGDTLSEIAARFGVSLSALLEANPQITNPRVIYSGQVINIPGDVILPPTGGGGGNVPVPTITVAGVRKGQLVTIQGKDFPKNVIFNVLMGAIGTRGLDGVYVDTINSGSDGEFTATFNIPRSLQDEARIAIRLQSPNTAYYSYTWFENRTSGRQPGQDVTPDLSGRPEQVRSFGLAPGRNTDAFLGNAGVYLPDTVYDGELWIARYDPDRSNTLRDIQWTQQLVEVRVLKDNGDRETQVRGVNYLYFNLDQASRAAYDRGNLDIYRYDPGAKAWLPCASQTFIGSENQPYGRLACILTDFGLYGIAIQQ